MSFEAKRRPQVNRSNAPWVAGIVGGAAVTLAILSECSPPSPVTQGGLPLPGGPALRIRPPSSGDQAPFQPIEQPTPDVRNGWATPIDPTRDPVYEQMLTGTPPPTVDVETTRSVSLTAMALSLTATPVPEPTIEEPKIISAQESGDQVTSLQAEATATLTADEIRKVLTCAQYDKPNNRLVCNLNGAEAEVKPGDLLPDTWNIGSFLSGKNVKIADIRPRPQDRGERQVPHYDENGNPDGNYVIDGGKSAFILFSFNPSKEQCVELRGTCSNYNGDRKPTVMNVGELHQLGFEVRFAPSDTEDGAGRFHVLMVDRNVDDERLREYLNKLNALAKAGLIFAPAMSRRRRSRGANNLQVLSVHMDSTTSDHTSPLKKPSELMQRVNSVVAQYIIRDDSQHDGITRYRPNTPPELMRLLELSCAIDSIRSREYIDPRVIDRLNTMISRQELKGATSGHIWNTLQSLKEYLRALPREDEE